MITEMDGSNKDNYDSSYLGAMSATPAWPLDSKDPLARAYNTPRSSFRHNTSALYGNSTNINGASSRFQTNNNSGALASSTIIRAADGRVFRPVAVFRADDQRSSEEQATFAGAAPSHGQLSLRDIELHLSQRPSSRRYLRHGSRNLPGTVLDGVTGPNTASGALAGTALAGRQSPITGAPWAAISVRRSQQTQRNLQQPHLLSQRYGAAIPGSKHSGEQRSFGELARHGDVPSPSLIQKSSMSPATGPVVDGRGGHSRDGDPAQSIVVEVHESYQTVPGAAK